MISVILLAFLAIGSPQGRETRNQGRAASDQFQELQASSSKAVQVPAFGYYDEPKCDSSGNVFFRPDAPKPGSVLKISKDGSQSNIYLLPAEYRGDLVDVAVDPSGVLYDLLMAKQASIAVEFDGDGSVKHTTRLGVPNYVSPTRFAVFNDGAIIYWGHPNRFATEEQKRGTYTAAFDPSGNLVRELPDHHTLSTVNPTKLPDGAIAVAQDGNAYVLSSDMVTVVSETGEVVRRIPFQKPRPEDSATRLDVSGGLLSIGLIYSIGKKFGAEYLVMDTDGKRVGLFRPSPDLGASVVCFSADTGFTFLKEGPDPPKLINAPLR
jgi:hypothetical protein